MSVDGWIAQQSCSSISSSSGSPVEIRKNSNKFRQGKSTGLSHHSSLGLLLMILSKEYPSLVSNKAIHLFIPSYYKPTSVHIVLKIPCTIKSWRHKINNNNNNGLKDTLKITWGLVYFKQVCSNKDWFRLF